MTTTDTATRNSLMEQILYKWTGSDTIDPNSRGANIDARKLAVLEKFFGQAFVSQYGANPIAEAATLLKEAYRGLSEMIYSQLMAQTHLKDLYGAITYTWNDATQNVKADMSAVITDIQNQLSTNSEAGKTLLGEFSRTIRGFGAQDMVNYLNFRETFITQDPELGWIIDSAGLPVYDQVGEGQRTWSPHIEGTNNADAVKGSLTEGDGYLNSLLGNDVIYGTERSEILFNTQGNSTLVAGGGSDIIMAGAGDDILDGGEGSDILYGEAGNDTYIFRVGSGQDTVIDPDPTAGNTDTIYIGNSVQPSGVSLRRIGNDLILRLTDTTDKLTVKDYFKNESPLNRIEQIQFMDGTIWDVNEIYRRIILPSETDDTIYGTQNSDILNGFGGDDTIHGLNGNDTLEGGTGDDKLYGGEDEDILDGGSGVDMLDGGAGNDTYKFGRGSGQDTISDTDATAGNLDAIVLGSGIQPSEVSLQRSGEDIILKINDSPTDRLTIKNYFLNEDPQYQIENIRFGDGTVWGVESVKNILLQGTSGNDTIIGYSTGDAIQGLAGNDTIYSRAGDDRINGNAGDDKLYGETGNDMLQGGDGSDTLYGGADNDILDGGGGNDKLYGEAGNDAYIFGRGSGQDTIIDTDSTAGNIDKIWLGSNLTPNDVAVRRIGNDLILGINDTTDCFAKTTNALSEANLT